MTYVIDNLNMIRYLIDQFNGLGNEKFINFNKITPVFHQWGVTVSTETDQISPLNQFFYSLTLAIYNFFLN